MRRIASCLLLSSVVLAAASCVGEDDEPQHGPLAWDSGTQRPCPTCVVDAGLVTSQAETSSACNALDPGACAGHQGCAPIVGLAYDPVRYCRAEAQLPVYCQSASIECGFGLTRVIDPVGQRWVLPNRCIPPGYKDAPMEIHPITWIQDYTVCPNASLQTRCGLLDERGCAANPACVSQRGTQLNERSKCKDGEERFVACVQNTTCNRVLTYARDSTGGTWELALSCLPSGYTALPTSSIVAHMNWPACF